MLARSEIFRLLRLGRDGEEGGIGVVPSPLDFAEEQVGKASLDVRLGRWFLALHQSKRPSLDLSQRESNPLENNGGRYYYVPFGETFVVHPGRFVLASTLEWIQLPGTIGAYITGKSSLGRRGLIIETAAGVHPHFNGCLALEISNCGEVPIAITPGMRIAQLFFHRVEGSTPVASSSLSGFRKPIFGSHTLDFAPKEFEPELDLGQ